MTRGLILFDHKKDIIMDITPEIQSALNEAAIAAVKSIQPPEPPKAAEPAQDISAIVDVAVKSYLDKFTDRLGVATAPHESKSGLGDNYVKATAAFIRSGQQNSGMKASNATDMNVGTAADGGNLVPTGHYQGIIARRNESDLATKLGLTPIPGKGTTVDAPYDNADVSEFPTTAEAAASDLDAPVFGLKPMTLVRKTKRVVLSNELLDGEDSQLMAFLEDWVGRAFAVTRNKMLVTEVTTNGTALKTFAAGAAIAAGELEDILYSSNLAYYLEDGGSIAWVTQPATYGALTKISGNYRWYGETAQGKIASTGPLVLGYPVLYSQAVAAPAVNAKSILFGNWRYVGVREGNGMTFLRDPFTLGSNGQIQLIYTFHSVFGVSNPQAIGYGVQAAA